MVQGRREPHLPITTRCLTYPRQRTVRARSALSPVRVLLSRVSFGQTPFLHPLRGRCPGVVRRLHRYYGPVRLPLSVHHRRASIDFSVRPIASSVTGGHGIFWLPGEVFPYLHGVCDHAGPGRTSRYRCARYGLPLLLTASASRRKFLSRLNTQPVRTLVNASALSLRATRMTRGRYGSLRLYRMTLSFTTPRRFRSAHKEHEMIYVKNLPLWERSLRIGLGMAAAAYAVLNLDSVWVSPRQTSRGFNDELALTTNRQ